MHLISTIGVQTMKIAKGTQLLCLYMFSFSCEFSSC